MRRTRPLSEANLNLCRAPEEKSEKDAKKSKKARSLSWDEAALKEVIKTQEAPVPNNDEHDEETNTSDPPSPVESAASSHFSSEDSNVSDQLSEHNNSQPIVPNARQNLSPIPNSGLSEEEEWSVVGFGASTSFSEEDEDLDLEHDVALYSAERVQRKAPPRMTLEEISREIWLSKLSETRPATPSLLADRDRPAGRIAYPNGRIQMNRPMNYNPDALRRESIERRRFLQSRRQLAPMIHPLNSRLETRKPQLFPRAGDLLQLRSPDPSALVDDWELGCMDLCQIQKTLFAFDLRMRSRDWYNEEEEEVYHSYEGQLKEWEYCWERRWKVASWLLGHQDADEDDVSA